ncbi:MAG TPA: transglycosylase domain-containing protein [Rhizomicrobium sp.]|jgi:penicillin-binding protein 1A|nr:transglycosylase domain-containing protein [Rhizomicrobium sp.]
MARDKIEPSFKKRGTAAEQDVPIRALPPRKPKRKRTWPYVLALFCAWAVILVAAFVAHLWSELPDVGHLRLAGVSHDITILDRHGRLIARKDLTQGAMVNVRDLPPYVPDAFIAIEDRRFREHMGLDFIGMVRAALENLAAGHVVQGGSTITQQLAKNLFLDPKRTFDRKGQEALLAIYLESHYSKDQILTLYLNHVYFGAGVYGIEAASERFFGRPATELSLSEAAILAGSVKAPAKYNPLADRVAAHTRAQTVLKAMREAGFITDRILRVASETAPHVMLATGTPGAGYFADWVVSRIPGYVGDIHEPVVVETTFDLPLQEKAEQAVEAGLAGEGRKLHAHEAALIALAPDGAVRAMVGGRSYVASPYNRAADAKRQPGSAFKPFVYLAALEHGHHLDDVMNDGPVSFGKWRPGNYEGRYEGRITLTRAFAKSSNSVAAQLTLEAGPRAVVRTAHRLGIASHLMAVPSIALGSETVTPLELTAAYAPFANGGERALPYAIQEIRTKRGHVLYRRKARKAERVMSAEQAGEVAQLMVATVTTGTGKAARLEERPSAGKTGTTQDYRDAWFVGFTSDYVCGVWIGNDHNTPMVHATGGTLPSRMFKSFMQEAEQGFPVEPLTSIRLAPPPPAPVSAVASVDSAAPDGAARSATSSNEPRSAFDKLLDSLFGGH